jgi:hypothetical protein
MNTGEMVMRNTTLAVMVMLLLGCGGEPNAQPVDESGQAPQEWAEQRVEESASRDPDPSGGDAVLLEEHVVRDPGRGNMPAIRLLVPEDWTLEGQIAPAPAYGAIPYLSDITVEAPDKRGVRFWGINEFGYADGVRLRPLTPYHERPFMPIPSSLGEFWTTMFQLNPGPGIRDLEIVDEQQLPELTKLVREQLAQLYRNTEQENMQLRMRGERKTFDVHARKLVIRYEDEGTPVEATIFATVRQSIYFYANGAIRAAMWNLDNMYAVFGPVGTDYMEDPVLAAIVRSKKALPDWSAAVQQWYLMKNRQIVAEGRARIAAQARQAATARASQGDDILDMSFNSWKRRNAMSDAGHASTIRGIREETTYAMPSGGTVDLPSYYQNVYSDGLGNYVLHNDANYQINTDPTFNGREWQRIRPVRR